MNGITKQTRRQSYDDIRTRSGERCKLILETLGNRSMTVEEITDELVAAGHLKYYDRNFVAPRLTELKGAGVLEVVGKKPKKQKVQAKINLEALAGGAFAEKLNEALMQVAENIQNPNTEATTKRQITVNIKFTPNKTRQMVGTQIAVTTKLAATEAIDTQMVMGVNMRTGQIEIAEYDGQIRGQMDLSDFTDADQDQEPEETQAAAPTPGQNPTGKPLDLKNRGKQAPAAAAELVPGRDYDPDTGEVYETAGQSADDRQTTSGRNNIKVVKIAPVKEA